MSSLIAWPAWTYSQRLVVGGLGVSPYLRCGWQLGQMLKTFLYILVGIDFFSKWKWNPTGKLHLMPLISTASGAISGRLDHVLLLDSDSSGLESEVDAAQISLTIIYFFVRVMTTTSQHVNIYKSCGVGRATKQQVWIHWEL